MISKTAFDYLTEDEKKKCNIDSLEPNVELALHYIYKYHSKELTLTELALLQIIYNVDRI